MMTSAENLRRWQFMLRNMARTARQRPLTAGEKALFGFLTELVKRPDGDFANSLTGEHFAMLCSSCADPMWTEKE